MTAIYNITHELGHMLVTQQLYQNVKDLIIFNLFTCRYQVIHFDGLSVLGRLLGDDMSMVLHLLGGHSVSSIVSPQHPR